MHIYLDHAATTPMSEDVVMAMQPFYADTFGNPSSTHQWGRHARHAIDQARAEIASLLGVTTHHLTFTSGGTESDNMAIIGVALANADKGKHIITTQIEHHAVLHTCQFLEKMGFTVTYLPVDATGKVSLATLQEAVRPDTILVSIMYANNEVGTMQDIHALGTFLRERGIVFHTDAVQAIGIVPLQLGTLPVDLLSISAHKLGGPKGIGALLHAPHIKAFPLLHGGAQEKRRRAGTENVAGIVGFATALRLALAEQEDKAAKFLEYRKYMLDAFDAATLVYAVNGHTSDYLPHILHVSFPGADTESLLMNMDLAGIAASSGSACASGSLDISHVLQAMGLPIEVQRSAVRFSFGATNTKAEIAQAAQTIVEIVRRLQE